MYLCSFSTNKWPGAGLPTSREWGIQIEPESIGNLHNGDETVNIGQHIGATLKHG
jgi:hypothetical protein